jgi:hypothetical protein
MQSNSCLIYSDTLLSAVKSKGAIMGRAVPYSSLLSHCLFTLDLLRLPRASPYAYLSREVSPPIIHLFSPPHLTITSSKNPVLFSSESERLIYLLPIHFRACLWRERISPPRISLPLVLLLYSPRNKQNNAIPNHVCGLCKTSSP